MTLQLYYFPTLNGHKVTIALEEMGLAYDIVMVNILEGDQHKPEFLAINPNGRIPAMVDPDADGGPVTVFESAAILQYLGRKTGRFYAADEQTRAHIDSWLFWQMAGLGPISGQANWFTRVSNKPEMEEARGVDYALNRFLKETRRLFGVLERGLDGRDFLCGDYSIADMCCWTWIDKYPQNGGGLDDFPGVASWHKRIAQRPAVQRGLEAGIDLLPDAMRRKFAEART
ncbi:MAG: glutathione S-transferase N-terminal domain-containing protein [Novosphingobium sp.]|nr:glutathione S-transferase N-terminal domain-containing protein [Novosphingobium sp.]MCP5402442.1 glutathione S-transferase N-terminal domain-containing protein [Novosphingobium sp.]